jgi:hypothetical protein
MRVRRFVLARVDRFSFSLGFSFTQRLSVVRAKKRVRENCVSIGRNFLNACSGRSAKVRRSSPSSRGSHHIADQRRRPCELLEGLVAIVAAVVIVMPVVFALRKRA